MMIEKMIVLKENLKRVHKILQTISKEKEIAIALMLVDSENLDHIVDSIHSQADVDHLMAERVEYTKSKKAGKLTKDHHNHISNTNSQSNVNPLSFEPINLGIGLTQDLQENVESVQSFGVPTKIIEGEVDDHSIQHSVTSPYEENIQNTDIYDVVEMPDIPTRIADDQVIEEFMLEEIDSQGIDECKIVKLEEVPIKVINDQELEECMQEEVVTDMTLSEIYRVKIHTDVQLEIPIIKSEERHIVQDEPKLVQDGTLICAIPNPLQTNAQAQHMTEQKLSLPDRANIGKIIPTTYVSKRESWRSEVVRKEIPTYIDSLCRTPSKPPDKQNSLEVEISKKILPYINPIYRNPPQPPNTQKTKGERKWIFRKKPYTKKACRPPPKTHIHFTVQAPSVRSPIGSSTNGVCQNKGKNEYKGFR